MTLDECVAKNDLNVYAYGGDCVVITGYDLPHDLWICSDYVVSSVSGACVWLVKRSEDDDATDEYNTGGNW